MRGSAHHHELLGLAYLLADAVVETSTQETAVLVLEIEVGRAYLRITGNGGACNPRPRSASRYC